MALNSVTPAISDYQKLKKSFTFEKRPLIMLKDYLLDDLSSSSSTGFKSFPRQQCCTKVRIPTELDVKKKPKTLRTSPSKSKAASTTINNALRRASVAFLNAVRLISLPATVKSLTLSRSSKKAFLPRNFSSKIFRKSFQGKTAETETNRNERNDIKRWKSFREYLEEEKDQQFDCGNAVVPDSVSIDISSKSSNTISTTTTSWDDNGSNCTSENLISSGSSKVSITISRNAVGDDDSNKSNSSSSNNNVRSKRSGAAIGEESPETTTSTTTSSEDSNRVWSSEKEQFSPVSVLDCPFEDDEEITSPFPCAKQKLRPKTRRFENLSQLEPRDLEKKIALSGLENGNKSPTPPMLQPSSSAEETITLQKEEELLNIINTTYPKETSILQVDNLLLDFFAESLPGNGHENNAKQELLNIAKHWIKGQPLELYLGWEVKEKRKLYLRELEKDGKWRKMDEDKQELVHALELQCWTSLVDEVLSDLLHW